MKNSQITGILNKRNLLLSIITLFLLTIQTIFAQNHAMKIGSIANLLPTPSTIRTASGSPGKDYWQNKVDYDMNILLNDSNQTIEGTAIITFNNFSPDALSYLWLHLDQNEKHKHSDQFLTAASTLSEQMEAKHLFGYTLLENGLGYNILEVKDLANQNLDFTINKTMMRIDLPKVLESKKSFTFQIRWKFKICDRSKYGGRSGFEYFPLDDNYLYTIAQFFPRMCVYSDVRGWQNKQFLGDAEFALAFGDYKVKISVPEDHIVGATGELKNSKEVLTAVQEKRFQALKASSKINFVVTEAEAKEKEKTKSKKYKTWNFEAQNVRDFAFASSRKFIWDGISVKIGNKNVLAMSLYPKEGNPLWEKYSTKAVAHTLKTYSKYSINYPYPVAYSVHSDNIGMEYPMISFNWGRPEADGTYSEKVKYSMISVIIHEVGHNFFPMVINSDERQWAWMDEGINSFVEFLAEQEWQRDFPSRRGPARTVTTYMKQAKDNLEPIMTQPEQIAQLGGNSYTKVASALTILRESIMGRELFDFAFKTYCKRWAFKSPEPADFFRTMEDASAIDLDWFWKAWFFEIQPVDISITEVKCFLPKSLINQKDLDKQKNVMLSKSITYINNIKDIPQTEVEKDSSLNDFYTLYQEKINPNDSLNYNLEEKSFAKNKAYFYQLKFKNIGGTLSPLILNFVFEDQTQQIARIPVEIWRKNELECSKVFYFTKPLQSIMLDPNEETADIDTQDHLKNVSNVEPVFINLTKTAPIKNKNPMQK